MAAVVRVKRRIDEEPLSAFVLNSKRRRVDANGDATGQEDEAASGAANKDELSTILKFAGTINEQDDMATTQIARLTKQEARELVANKSKKPVNATERARQEARENMQEQRFRVVNCLRTTLEDKDELNASDSSKEITIVDIEKQSSTNDKTDNSSAMELATNNLPASAALNNAHASTSAAARAAAASEAQLASVGVTTVTSLSMTLPSDSDTGYVYDLYIPDSEQLSDYVDQMDENYLSIRPLNENLFFEDTYDDDEYDSEDSNQENYYGNDYPDEDDDRDMYSDMEPAEIDEDDDDIGNLAVGLNNFVFGDEEDEDDDSDFNNFTSSSDEGNCYNQYHDPYVHSIDADEENFCGDVDSCDVDRYGLAYARYKARILKNNKAKTLDEDDDDDELGNNSDAVIEFDDNSNTQHSVDYDL